MRILFINRMASMVRGGGETFDVEMARHVAAMGHQITFLTGIPLFGKPRLPIGFQVSDFSLQEKSKGNAIPSNLQPSTCNLQPATFNLQPIHVRAPMLLWFPWDRVKGGWRVRIAEFKWFEWLAARWAWRHRDQFDIIQVCELPFFVANFKSRIPAKRGARPHPRETRDKPASPRNAGQARIPKLVMRLTAPDFHDPVDGLIKADAVIASGDTMQRVRAGVRPDCVDIPNGVDVERFGAAAVAQDDRQAFRQEWGLADNETIIVHVARFQTVKNHALLIDAFKKIANEFDLCRLLLVGSGPTRPSIEHKVAEAGLTQRVLFMGEVPHDRLPLVLATADIAVMSSDYESFCFAVLEGMAAGLPQVVTRTNWVPRLIGAQPDEGKGVEQVPGGFVTPVGQPGAFADGLRQLLVAPELRREMGAWNRAKAAQEHGWTSSAKKLENLYGRIRDR